jgi:hypothetical protein
VVSIGFGRFTRPFEGEFPREDFPTLAPQGLAADEHVEPLRAHKYPIPGGAHHGVQIKVSPSGWTPDIHSLRQQDVQQLWERHPQDH